MAQSRTHLSVVLGQPVRRFISGTNLNVMFLLKIIKHEYYLYYNSEILIEKKRLGTGSKEQ